MIHARELIKHAKTLDKSSIRSYLERVTKTIYDTYETEGTLEFKTNAELNYARQIVEVYGYDIIPLDDAFENIYTIKPKKGLV